NYYSRSVVADEPGGPMLGLRPVLPPESEYTEMGWEVYPDGLHKLLCRLQRDYAPRALYITENGCAFADRLEGGRVHDERRVAYLREHLAACWRAIQDGVPLRGYFVWSLLDNFEWTYGYSKRFGIVYVDYGTQERILKDSAHFYREVALANGLP
ncbi:MAG: family 1 glycosylhydrolase, partial [Anaerolineae bacterium]|nr:family 1 glycosylhydrolase [Anaerolineae bacterium]